MSLGKETKTTVKNDDASIAVDDPTRKRCVAKDLERKTGEEEFKENGLAIAKLLGYWQWSASDLLGQH